MPHPRQGLAFVDVTPDNEDPGKFNLTRRVVSTSDLAAVLALHRVRRVVLNACRSAHYQDADGSIALGILKAGVEECVAMTFDVVSRAVEIFMAIFYDAILTKGLALDAAAAWARHALRGCPDRQSCYATNIPVYDYVVPVCYTHALPPDSKACYFTGRALQFSRRPPFDDLIGREGDILSLETQLLASEKWLWLCGRAGVGKTTLLRHLSVWWHETGLASDVYLHDCRAATPQWSIEGFWRGAHNLLLPTVDYQGEDDVVEYLRRQDRCILIFDNLPASAERRCTLFIVGVLKRLDHRRTKVILAARSDEGWGQLDEYFEPRREALGGLSKLASLQMLRTCLKKAIRDMTGQAPKSVGESEEDLHCFEQLAALLAGNPTALRVIVAAFLHSRANTIKEFLAFLILGEPLMESPAAEHHLATMEQAEDPACVAELFGIIKSLAIPPAGKYDVPVEVLATFWGLLPRNDLPVVMAAYRAHASEDVPDDLQHDIKGDERFKFLVNEGPDFADFVKRSPMFSQFEAACARIVAPLEAAHFLSASTETPRGHSNTDYYTIHPLLPLLLRTSPLYHSHGSQDSGIQPVHIKQALVFYYTYRARTWPFKHQYFEPQWRPVREELGLEFTNFVSAVAMHGAMSKDLPNLALRDLMTIPLATVLHRGAGTEISRFQLAHLAQEAALDFVLAQEKRVADRAWFFDLGQQLLLMMLRMHGATLAQLRTRFVGQPTSEENKPFAALSGTLYQRMRQMGDPFVEGIFGLADITPARVRYLHRAQELASEPSQPTTEDELWELRRGFMRDSAAITGDTLHASQKSWDDVPRHAISGGALKLELLSVLRRARDAINRGELGEARDIIDAAWKREVFDRNDDRRHKAYLLALRAEICEREGDRESAAEHCREASRLVEGPGLGARRLAALGTLMDGSFQEFITQVLFGDVPLKGPWAAVFIWQMLVTPMQASELWVAIFIWQVITSPSPEPWMDVFFWQPMAEPAAAPTFWFVILLWLVADLSEIITAG